MESNKTHQLLKTIKERLSSQLGLEPDDINDTDDLVLDLHMQASDLTDFVEGLSESGIDTSSIDLVTIKTVLDLVESISSQEYVG